MVINNIMELTQLAHQGLAGISLALIGLSALVLNQLFKLMGNHINHNTEAWNRNTEALAKLSEKIDEDIKAQKETAEALRCLKL